MAERIVSRTPRVIPNWQMDKPWTTPLSPQEAEGLAQTALLSGAPDTDRAITTLLAQFAGDYVVNLQNASA